MKCKCGVELFRRDIVNRVNWEDKAIVRCPICGKVIRSEKNVTKFEEGLPC